MQKQMRSGASFIDLLVSMAIIAVLFGGIYLVYFSLISAVSNIGVRTAAATAINQEIEIIRNLPYASVGTLGGVPVGVIPQTQTSTVGAYTFTLLTTVRNIDDPFDGTLGGSPNDTAPADYKLVVIQASCPLCTNFAPMTITTTAGPKGLESAPQNGSLFIYAQDANGNPVQNATVQITNASVTPSINLIDVTNENGVLALVGTPTSTQGYQITVTKQGYSKDQTYPPGAPANPNPVKPNATVAAQSVTSISFAIDKVSTANVFTSDYLCAPVGEKPFSMKGTKLIGTNPDIIKFSTSSATQGGGSRTLQNIEWDTYTFALNDASQNLLGTIPLSPIVVNPSSTLNFRFVLEPAANPSLLVTVTDSASGVGIANATITLSKAGFSQTFTTDHATVTHTDWTGGLYSSQSGGIDADSLPGSLTLLVNASGTYTPFSTEWLISRTFDFGGSNSTIYAISWNPISEPPSTGAGSLKFQVAANNDDATWNFIGPDGTSNTYFTSSPSALPGALSGHRYFRFKAYLSTDDETQTPQLDDFTVDFAADCVPPAQVLFTNLSQGTYTLQVNAPNYVQSTSSVTIGSGAATSTVPLAHL